MRLLAHCANESRLATPENGVALRSHIKQRADKGDREAILMLRGPGVPDRVAHLWEWFLELNAGRRVGMNGAEPLAFVDIDAWQRLTDRCVAPREIHGLMAMDRAWRYPASIEIDWDAVAEDRDDDDDGSYC